MTAKMYLSSNAFEWDAAIVELGELDGHAWVELDQTIFHPQGGGQKADRGTISGIDVLHVTHTASGGVRHWTASLDGLCIGARVALMINGDTRRMHMKLHTGGHLIAALAERACGALKASSGHHWPNESRVDFEVNGAFPRPAELEVSLARALQVAIQAGLSVTAEQDANAVRVVRIHGFAPVPCGGTHVQSTAEVEHVTIRVRSKSGKLRISYDLPLSPT